MKNHGFVPPQFRCLQERPDKWAQLLSDAELEDELQFWSKRIGEITEVGLLLREAVKWERDCQEELKRRKK